MWAYKSIAPDTFAQELLGYGIVLYSGFIGQLNQLEEKARVDHLHTFKSRKAFIFPKAEN